MLITTIRLVIFVAALYSGPSFAAPTDCAEQGGQMECAGPQVASEQYALCSETGTFLWISNIENTCGWGAVSGDADIQQKAACFSSAYAGCPGAQTNPVVWSGPGERYVSSLCWTLETAQRNGIDTLNFARITGAATYRDGAGQCTKPGGYIGIVARRDRVLGCQDGWTRYDIPGGYQCRRPLVQVLQVSLTGLSETRPAGTGGISTIALAAKVTSGGQPKPGVAVNVNIDVTSNSGGHEHSSSRRPKGTLTMDEMDGSRAGATVSGITNANGEVKVTFNAPEVAGVHTLKATCASCSNSPATKEIQVKVPNLVEMLPDTAKPANYRLVGNTSGIGLNHKSNHWFSSASVTTLGKVVDAMFKTGWGAVGINDGSLMWGGLFDINGGWAPSHHGHRVGTEVDLSVTNPRSITAEQKTKTYAELCKKDNTAFSIQTLWHQDDGYPEHFHMYLDGTGLTKEAGGGPCCAQYKTTRVKKDKKGNPVLGKDGKPMQETVKLCTETSPR